MEDRRDSFSQEVLRTVSTQHCPGTQVSIHTLGLKYAATIMFFFMCKSDVLRRLCLFSFQAVFSSLTHSLSNSP